jgi:hypothetical protein
MASQKYTPSELDKMYKDVFGKPNPQKPWVNELDMNTLPPEIQQLNQQLIKSYGKAPTEMTKEELQKEKMLLKNKPLEQMSKTELQMFIQMEEEKERNLRNKPLEEMTKEELEAFIALEESSPSQEKDKSTFGQVGRLLKTTERPSNTPYPELDKEFAQKFAKVSKIADFPIGEGHTITSALLQQVYGPAGLEVIPKDGGQYELRDKFTQETYTPDTVNALGQLGSVATAIGVGIPTAMLAAPTGLLGMAAAEGAVSGAQETAELTKAAMEAKKLGLVPSVGDVIGKKKGQIGIQTALGAAGGAAGELLTGLFPAAKAGGKLLERMGNRGEIEKLTARQIMESKFTQDLLESTAGKEFTGGEIIKNAVERKLNQTNLQAQDIFNKVRSSPKGGENNADLTGWFSEFAQRFEDQPKLVAEVADALGGRTIKTPSKTITETSISPARIDPITGQPVVAQEVYNPATLQYEVRQPYSPATAADKFEGYLVSPNEVFDPSSLKYYNLEKPYDLDTFVEKLQDPSRAYAAKDLPPEMMKSTTKTTTPASTTFEMGTVDPITHAKTNPTSASNFLDTIDLLKNKIDVAKRTDPELYKRLVDAKTAFERPVSKLMIEEAGDVVATGASSKIGYTTFSNFPKLPENNAPFAMIKKGYSVLESGYKELPKKFRPFAINDDYQTIQASILSKQGAPKITQKEANSISKLLNADEQQQLADSYFAFKVQNATQTPTQDLFTNVSPETVRAAETAFDPKLQKAMQQEGKSVNFMKDVEGLEKPVTSYRIDADTLLKKSNVSDDTISALVGKENYNRVNKPFEDLYNIQNKPLQERNTFMGNIKKAGENVPGRKLTTDEKIYGGVGSLAGLGVGSTLGSMLGGPFTYMGGAAGYGVGGILGGMAGSNIRPIARAAGETLQQVPESLIQATGSPLARTATQAIMQGGRSAIQNPEAFNFDEEELQQLKFSPTSAASQLLQGFRR